MREWTIYKALGREDDVINGPDTEGDDVVSLVDVLDFLRERGWQVLADDLLDAVRRGQEDRDA